MRVAILGLLEGSPGLGIRNRGWTVFPKSGPNGFLIPTLIREPYSRAFFTRVSQSLTNWPSRIQNTQCRKKRVVIREKVEKLMRLSQ